mmetsp:Transcript_46575/g.131683  ORF Transcript_46575/g.131683 Transcript_46575/m.131683 type:complete len:225 (-) Transcript_46575:327-1001(-)
MVGLSAVRVVPERRKHATWTEPPRQCPWLVCCSLKILYCGGPAVWALPSTGPLIACLGSAPRRHGHVSSSCALPEAARVALRGVSGHHALLRGPRPRHNTPVGCPHCALIGQWTHCHVRAEAVLLKLAGGAVACGVRGLVALRVASLRTACVGRRVLVDVLPHGSPSHSAAGGAGAHKLAATLGGAAREVLRQCSISASGRRVRGPAQQLLGGRLSWRRDRCGL